MSDVQTHDRPREADATVALEGELSFDTVTQLAERHRDLRAHAGGTRIDLSRVTRADSAGLALLVEWSRQARADGRSIEFTQVPSQLMALARVSGLEGILALDGKAQAN